MKKALSILLVTVAAAVSASAQNNAPEVPDNANPRDNNIKMRSVELERVKRESAKTAVKPGVAVNPKIDEKFPQIKEDFEGIQISESAIIKTYTKDEKIDFLLIVSSADDINRRAKRLEENLFKTDPDKVRKAEKNDKKPEVPSAMRDIIIALDEAIGRLVTSEMFGNLRVVDPAVALKAHDDLTAIQALSSKLSEIAGKSKL